MLNAATDSWWSRHRLRVMVIVWAVGISLPALFVIWTRGIHSDESLMRAYLLVIGVVIGSFPGYAIAIQIDKFKYEFETEIRLLKEELGLKEDK